MTNWSSQRDNNKLNLYDKIDVVLLSTLINILLYLLYYNLLIKYVFSKIAVIILIYGILKYYKYKYILQNLFLNSILLNLVTLLAINNLFNICGCDNLCYHIINISLIVILCVCYSFDVLYYY